MSPFRTNDKAWLKIPGIAPIRALAPQGDPQSSFDVPSLLDPQSSKSDKARRANPDELKQWIKAVGNERATAAWLTRNQIMRGRLHGKPSMIECLTEAFLRDRRVDYEAQVELGIARPDYVVFNTRSDSDDGAVIWNINGNYWHALRTWHDYGKANALINVKVNGIPIVDAIDIWESDILRSNQVFEDALRGERYRN